MGSLWFQWVVYPPLDKWIWEGTPATLNLWLKNEKHGRRGCAGYWKFSSRKSMKEEFNLYQKHYNSVCGLSELTVGVLSSVCLQPFLGQEHHQALQGGTGREKTSLVHPVSGYSAVHQDWCVGLIFFFNRHVERTRVGGWLKGGRNGFILHDEIVSHRKHQGPTSSHSCIMISENLVCKL